MSSGVRAQEETLFHRTAYHRHTNPARRPKPYPMPPGRCVVARGVVVVKDEEYRCKSLGESEG